MEGVLTYEPPLPMEELPRLLRDVVPSLKIFLSKQPPFNIGNSLRLTVPDEIAKAYPKVDELFKLYSGKEGQRKMVEHSITESEDTSRDIVSTFSVPERSEDEYYFVNISVRNDLSKEANALLSSLFESEVCWWMIYDHSFPCRSLLTDELTAHTTMNLRSDLTFLNNFLCYLFYKIASCLPSQQWSLHRKYSINFTQLFFRHI